MSRLLAGMLIGIAALLSAPLGAAEQPPVAVLMHTELGDIRILLEAQRAPVTVTDFLRYVDQKRFDGITFYRAVKVGDAGTHGLVQGGPQGDRARELPPIAHEAPADTGLSHIDGALSMARHEPGTAAGDFFIVVGDLPALDGAPGTADPGYAVFGRVTEGMDIVRRILDMPRSVRARSEAMRGEMLAEPVKILSVRRANPTVSQ